MTVSHEEVTALLKRAAQEGASEIHLKVPNRVLFRIGDVLLPKGREALTPQATLQFANRLLEIARLEVPLATATHREFSFGLAGVGRFHVLLYRQRGSLGLIIDRLAFGAPSLDSLGIDPTIEQCLARPGLVLITGGPARVPLLHTLVDRYNAAYRGFCVVLEDPMTHLHKDAMATIAQRGVGTDVPSLHDGVLTAIRQKADVVAVGDVPDRDTAEAAAVAAEAGLVTLACVAAPSPELATSWLTRFYASLHEHDIGARIQRVLSGIATVPTHGDPRWIPRSKMRTT